MDGILLSGPMSLSMGPHSFRGCLSIRSKDRNVSSQARKYNGPPSTMGWRRVRPRFIDLYFNEKLSLSDVRDAIHLEFGIWAEYFSTDLDLQCDNC